MENVIVAIVILAIIGAAATYIVKEKKKGAVCIGCPHSGTCGSKNNQESGCSCK